MFRCITELPLILSLSPFPLYLPGVLSPEHLFIHIPVFPSSQPLLLTLEVSTTIHLCFFDTTIGNILHQPFLSRSLCLFRLCPQPPRSTYVLLPLRTPSLGSLNDGSIALFLCTLPLLIDTVASAHLLCCLHSSFFVQRSDVPRAFYSVHSALRQALGQAWTAFLSSPQAAVLSSSCFSRTCHHCLYLTASPKCACPLCSCLHHSPYQLTPCIVDHAELTTWRRLLSLHRLGAFQPYTS